MDGEQTQASTYLLVMVYGIVGSSRFETFAYPSKSSIIDVLHQELRDPGAVDRVLSIEQEMVVIALERGRPTSRVDVRGLIDVLLADGERRGVDETRVGWHHEREEVWTLKSSFEGPAPEVDDLEQPVVGLALREDAFSLALPPLQGRPLAPGGKIVVEGSLGLGRPLREVVHGYRDGEGMGVARGRFVDPEPPAPGDFDAWLTRELTLSDATRLAAGVTSASEARRLLEVARGRGLRLGPIEAEMRHLVPPSALPLRPATSRRARLHLETLSESDDAEIAPLAALLRLRRLRELATVARRGELSRLAEAPDASPTLQVLVYVLQAYARVGRTTAWLQDAVRVPSDALVPCLALAMRQDTKAAAEGLEALRRRLATNLDGSPIDRHIVGAIPDCVSNVQLYTNPPRPKLELAALLEGLSRVVADPDEACGLAAHAGRLSLEGDAHVEAHRAVQSAIRYWEAHAPLRPLHEVAEARMVEAAAIACVDLEAGLARRKALVDAVSDRGVLGAAQLARHFAPPRQPTGQCVGDAVRHAKFGHGEIVAVEGEGDGMKLTVCFANGAKKTLLARFLTPHT